MKNAFIDLWCELCEAVWRGIKLAITITVVLIILFNVLLRETHNHVKTKKAAREAAEQVYPNPINEFAGLEEHVYE